MSNKHTIGIVGLGLIGGSIEKRLKDDPRFEVLCVSRSQEREHQLEDLSKADIVFLCGSQSDILKQLESIAKIISDSSKEGTVAEDKRAFFNTIITDVASTKSKVSSKAEELGLKNFIPGHPMAGTEEQGYEASSDKLFEGAKWVLSESSSKTELLEEIVVKVLGAAEIVLMDPETHDRAVAMVSHLPLLLSLSLADMASNFSPATKVTGSGFESMTRLAKGNANLGREIISFNRHNIKDVWEIYKSQVESILNIYGEDLENELEDIKEAALALA